MKKQFGRPFDEYRQTTNSKVYNRLRKGMLSKKGEIRCSYCKYHCNENKTDKYYGQIRSWKLDESTLRYPNWKLVTKKKKQWMNGTYRKKIRNTWDGMEYVEFKI